ncbi:MAG: hypothetical protein KBT34_04570 [Prevotella sp.]|nr:hypothetical protein [Candidatus Prevotella equi]
MTKQKIQWQDLHTSAEISLFSPDGKNNEMHVIMHVEPCNDNFSEQWQRLIKSEERLLSMPDSQNLRKVFKRLLVSDATNQSSILTPTLQHDIQSGCVVSIIQQPPLDGSKIAVWLYLNSGSNYEHHWVANMVSEEEGSEAQTHELLDKYEKILCDKGMNIYDNCLRTWFYVRDVDTRYHGMVVARRENFTANGLTSKTHYIASTGICGTPSNAKSIVQLDAYAIKDINPQQIHYLYAPTHLNPTYEYGVTFERGTMIEYGDRRHVIISGTASINNKGEVMHCGDIIKQTKRMWENVETLLNEAEASFNDVAQIIVYLRDTADYAIVKKMFEERFTDTPYVITLAPVCRPAWLIEMECIAITQKGNGKYKNY